MLDTGPRRVETSKPVAIPPSTKYNSEDEELIATIAPKTPDIVTGNGYDADEKSIIRDIVAAQVGQAHNT